MSEGGKREPGPFGLDRRLSVGLFYVGLSEAISRGAVLAFSIAAARALSVEQFGVFGTAVTVAAFLWVIADGGQTAIGVRDVATGYRSAEEALFHVTGMRLTAALVVVFLVVLASSALPRDDAAAIVGAALFVISQAIFPAWLFRAVQQYRGYMWSYARVGLLFGLFSALCFLSPGLLTSAGAAASLRSLAWLLGALWAVQYLYEQLPNVGGRLLPKIDLSSLRRAWPIAMAALITGTYPLIAFASLRLKGDLSGLGHFAAVWQLQLVVLAGGSMLTLIFFPAIYRGAAVGSEALRWVVRTQIFVSAIFVICVTFLLTTLGGWLVGAAFGVAYRVDDEIFALLSLAVVGQVCKHLGEAHIIKKSVHRLMAPSALLGAVMAFAFVIAHEAGIRAAVAAYAIGELLYGLLICFYSARWFKFFWLVPLVMLLVPAYAILSGDAPGPILILGGISLAWIVARVVTPTGEYIADVKGR